jgi:hypothetical protein
MTEHQILGAMLGFLGVLTMGGLIILGRMLLALQRQVGESIRVAEETLREVRQR